MLASSSAAYRWIQLQRGGSMGPAMMMFILFFGIALLDALRGGEWLRVAFWVAIGLLFFLLERRGLRGTR